jgi:hypothetical protein
MNEAEVFWQSLVADVDRGVITMREANGMYHERYPYQPPADKPLKEHADA